MLRKVPLAEGEYYHLYSRGVEKRNIFLDDYDRSRFLKLLFLANGEKSFVYRDIEDAAYSEIDKGGQLVAVGAYVLMPNHFHILVKEIRQNGTTDFMRKLLTGYSSYFNKRHNRVGTLFQSRFKAQHVHRDEHLKYLFAYIHLNPVKIIEPQWKEKNLQNLMGVKKFLDGYTYSSYQEYIGPSYGSREESAILSRQVFPDYFASPHSFKDFVQEWLTYKEVANT
ncbi:MAG: transposase [bacterium]|nr:transposase [bacterium]